MNTWTATKKSEDNHLPPIKACYSKLNLSEVSVYDNNHAQRVWREFGVKNLGDYHDLYLEMDVLLLCNVFETLRTTCLEHYTLTTHFYTSLGLASQASLKRPRLA